MAKLSSILALWLLPLALMVLQPALRHVVEAEQIPLNDILPKLKAIHDDSQSLLLKNAELKAQIMAGLQVQQAARPKVTQDQNGNQQQVPPTTTMSPGSAQINPQSPPQVVGQIGPTPPMPMPMPHQPSPSNQSGEIDYAELQNFNKWVEVNLEYAVLNTQASTEALKEEALTSNGTVEYSEQAVKDGIEGVKYWQQAVIFQDKTLKNEKFEISE